MCVTADLCWSVQLTEEKDAGKQSARHRRLAARSDRNLFGTQRLITNREQAHVAHCSCVFVRVCARVCVFPVRVRVCARACCMAGELAAFLLELVVQERLVVPKDMGDSSAASLLYDFLHGEEAM